VTGRLTRLAAIGAALAALSGCGFKGAYSLPLPGGSGTGPTYHVTAVFDNVQDLVPMAAVRVDDVAVGDVTSINYDPKTNMADVGMRIKDSVHLPANAVATLEQTTLLGEKYIAIEPPTNVPPEGSLSDGATIGHDRTSRLPDVEEVFGVLSAVLNGGDLQDLQTINVEIAKALTGREQAVKGALNQLTVFVKGLDSQKQQIVHALDELDRLSGALSRQRDTIATALDDLGPGLQVLADERQQFTTLLSDLARFGTVATRIINASTAQTVAGLRDLQPILHHLQAAGTNLPHSLELLITYPFPKNIDAAIPGDYNGLKLSFNADPVFCTLVPLPLPTCKGAATGGAATGPGGAGTGSGTGGSGTGGLPTVGVPDPGTLLGELLNNALPGGTQ
jgi:phospholipid/cholesterol/gamma-HCH transport system substrate-binding protein